MNPAADRIRKMMGNFLLIAATVYVVLSIYLILFPRTILITKKVTQYYQWFGLPGPFFRDDRIRMVPHLYFSSKKMNEPWSEWRDIERENFLTYHDNFFSYASLKRSRYERTLGRSLGKRILRKPQSDPTKSREFNELHAYLKKRYLPEETDSVKLLYMLEDLQNRTESADTAFHFKYKLF